MATTDFLTGLSNRRHFDDILQKEWRRLRRYGNHFALVIIDLDHFKGINDRCGHQGGDEVLKKTADAQGAGAGGGHRGPLRGR